MPPVGGGGVCHHVRAAAPQYWDQRLIIEAEKVRCSQAITKIWRGQLNIVPGHRLPKT